MIHTELQGCNLKQDAGFTNKEFGYRPRFLKSRKRVTMQLVTKQHEMSLENGNKVIFQKTTEETNSQSFNHM